MLNLRRSLAVIVVAAGAVLFGAGTASARLATEFNCTSAAPVLPPWTLTCVGAADTDLEGALIQAVVDTTPTCVNGKLSDPNAHVSVITWTPDFKDVADRLFTADLGYTIESPIECGGTGVLDFNSVVGGGPVTGSTGNFTILLP